VGFQTQEVDFSKIMLSAELEQIFDENFCYLIIPQTVTKFVRKKKMPKSTAYGAIFN
jgi:hypothetical protein